MANYFLLVLRFYLLSALFVGTVRSLRNFFVAVPSFRIYFAVWDDCHSDFGQLTGTLGLRAYRWP